MIGSASDYKKTEEVTDDMHFPCDKTTPKTRLEGKPSPSGVGKEGD